MKIKNKLLIAGFLILVFLKTIFLVTTNNTLLLNLDNAVNNWFINNQSSAVYNFMLVITNIGDVYVTIIIFLIFGSFLLISNKNSLYILTLASASGVIFAKIIKELVQRVRPENLLEKGFGFPSGHATISIVFLLASIYLIAPIIKNRLMKNVFLVITSFVFTLVAFSRIYLSVHFTSDVIAGIILGSICFIFAEIICCYKKENVL